MTNELARRALGAGFAAALLLGAAACGDDEVPDDESPGVVDGLGGTDDPDSGIDTGEGLGGAEGDEGTQDTGDEFEQDPGTGDDAGGTDEG